VPATAITVITTAIAMSRVAGRQVPPGSVQARLTQPGTAGNPRLRLRLGYVDCAVPT
jgi:hypothetical protein